MKDSLAIIAYRVACIPDQSHNLRLYAGALVQARDMEVLPKDAEQRELRIRNTRIVALRRLGKLDAADRARVEAAGGVIE